MDRVLGGGKAADSNNGTLPEYDKNNLALIGFLHM
jgi:hypothetical protein